jgi:hypothetical protein
MIDRDFYWFNQRYEDAIYRKSEELIVATKREMMDITAPEHGVVVSVRDDEKVLWVDVDGICVLRICQIPSGRLEIEYNIEETG